MNETTDVMEEDAVNFLSSLSERARDEHIAEGEAESPGSGADSGDGKSGRKGRKSIPRKITQGEGEDADFPKQSQQTQGIEGEVAVVGNMQPAGGATKPFVIQNPDTDDEINDEEEEGEIRNPPPIPIPNNIQGSFDNMAPMTSVMNFQPLNVCAPIGPEVIAASSKRAGEEDLTESDKRPRRQSQRRSPKVHTSDVEQSDDDDDNDGDNNDNTDTDWVPGSRRRNRGKVELGDRRN